MSDVRVALHTTANRRAGNKVNEDAALLLGEILQGEVVRDVSARPTEPLVFAVSDGVHSSPKADEASRTVLEFLDRSYRKHPGKLPARRLRDLQTDLGELLIPPWSDETDEDDEGKSFTDDPRLGMTATLVGVELTGALGKVFHIGDSKAWLVTANEARLMTTDHTIANSMIEDGHAPESFRHSAGSRYRGLDRYLVADPMHEPSQCDVADFEFATGHTIVLCSDGLDVVEHSSYIRPPNEILARYVQRLVARACELGSDDNITVLAVEMVSVSH